MICIYDGMDQDFASNGLAILEPTQCTVTEKAGGAYEATLTHPITNNLKWQCIKEHSVIKVPVPACETPEIQLYHEGKPGTAGKPGRNIWRVHVTTSGASGHSRIYSKPTTGYAAWEKSTLYKKGAKVTYKGRSYRWDKTYGTIKEPPDDWKKIASPTKVLQKLKEGTEYEYLGEAGRYWHKAISAEGVSGYMYTANSQFVRTEDETPAAPAIPGYSSVVKPRQIRSQLFRIYEVKVDTQNQTISAYARHISYDFGGNLLGPCNIEDKLLITAADDMQAALMVEDDRQIVAGMDGTITADYSYKNGIAALLDPDEGMVPKLHARLVRDNEDFFILPNDMLDRGVVVAYGKNLTGVTWTKNSEEICTRIVPLGQNKDGDIVMLPEQWIDSQYIDDYPIVKAKKLEVSEAKEKEATDDDPAVTLEDIYVKLREAAQEEFDSGCDLVTFELDVDFVHLGDTDEYAQYKNLQQVFLYDTITIRHAPMGFEAKAQVSETIWDAVTQRYTSVKIGDVFAIQGGGIAGYELPSGGISGTKLVPGGVDGSRLRDLAVTNAKIGYAAIMAANIAQAQIENAHIVDATIDKAKIKDFSAEVANIAIANINEANIDVAQIQNLTAKVASIVKADIEWADIAKLSAQVAMIAQAEISNAKITSAQITDLSAAAASIAKAEIKEAEIDTAQVRDFTAAVAQIALANIKEANINVAQIENLSAWVAEIMEANIQTANIDWANIASLSAAIAEISLAQIETADVDFLHVKDTVTNQVIFTQGVGGKVYITDLIVEAGNIRELTVNNLLAWDADGNMRQMIINPDGTSTWEITQMKGPNIGDQTIDNINLKDGIINARTLAAKEIFADEATMISLFSGMGRFGEIFAASAVMPHITASVIESNALKISVKEQIGYRVEIVATSDILSSDIQQTTLAARVWQGNKNVTDDIPSRRFAWKRTTADETADRLWSTAHVGVKTILLTVQDVWYSATYTCEIEEE